MLNVSISFFVETQCFGNWLCFVDQVDECEYKIWSSGVSIAENLVISLAKLFV
jgi:hypothetical protein